METGKSKIENRKSFIVAFVLASGFLLLTSAPAHAVKPVDIFTKSVPNGQNGVAYSATVKAKFGTKPYTWSIGSGALPTGLSIAAATGIISGTPTVNGTYNFVAHVVDSAGSPTSDNQSLHITVTGAAPAPTPAVSITTGSVPSGIVGGAYNTTLQATGGTAPYTWSIPPTCVAPNCALPPATSLASNGTISGTLTAAGTYSFTARVTDSSPTPQTADRAFSASVAAGGTYLFKDDFESGNFAAWDNAWLNVWSVQSSFKHAGTYAAQGHYVICGDSTNPACGASHQDNNGNFEKTYDTAALPEIWTRGYFYIKSPEPRGSKDGVGRKLFYFTAGCFSCSLFPSGDPWSVIVGVADLGFDFWPGAGPLKMTFGLQNTPIGGQSYTSDCGTVNPGPITGIGCALQYDTWYSLEMRVKYNTLAASPWNGLVQMWIDGAMVYNWPWDLNRATAYHLRLFRFGAQADRDNYVPVDEYRYWDDLILNNSYIGP